MKKLTKEKGIMFLAVAVVALLFLSFYWSQVRPARIRKKCIKRVREIAREQEGGSFEVVNYNYRTCLTQNGLKAEDLFKL